MSYVLFLDYVHLTVYSTQSYSTPHHKHHSSRLPYHSFVSSTPGFVTCQGDSGQGFSLRTDHHGLLNFVGARVGFLIV